MNDLISREEVYKALTTAIDEQADIFDAVKAIPSADRPSGWVNARDGYSGHVKCNQCFKTYDWDAQAQYYNFCPNCGADMRKRGCGMVMADYVSNGDELHF